MPAVVQGHGRSASGKLLYQLDIKPDADPARVKPRLDAAGAEMAPPKSGVSVAPGGTLTPRMPPPQSGASVSPSSALAPSGHPHLPPHQSFAEPGFPRQNSFHTEQKASKYSRVAQTYPSVSGPVIAFLYFCGPSFMGAFEDRLIASC